MDDVESDRERPPRPLASLGNDSHFLDAILGEILQPQLHDAMAREREWGRRRGTPSAPPLEVDVLDFGVFDFPELSPIGAAVAEPETAPQEEIASESSGPDDSATSAHLLELVTNLADNLNQPTLASQDGITCASAKPGDSHPPTPATLEGDPWTSVGLDDSSSSAHLLELVTTLADTLTPLHPAPCEITRCDSWEFSSLHVPTEPVLASGSASTCSSFDSLSRALHGLSAGRASMCLPRSQPPSLPIRPRSASPTLPQPHASADNYSTSNCTSSDDDADSRFTEALEESEHLG